MRFTVERYVQNLETTVVMQKSSSLGFPFIAGLVPCIALAGLVAGRFASSSTASPQGPSETSASPAPHASNDLDGDASDVRFKLPVTGTEPKRGPADALITVIEFCDLRGPRCRTADTAMQALMKAYEGQLRWVHRSQIDAARAQEARRMHNFARAAFQYADKFWEIRDKLLATPDGVELTEKDYERIAAELGMDYAAMHKGIADRQLEGAIAMDEAFAVKFGVREPAAFFVNGRPFHSQGGTGPNASEAMRRGLKELIDSELAEAERLVQAGVPRADVYRELTKDGLWSVGEKDELARLAALAENH